LTNPDATAPTTQSRRQALCGLAAALVVPGALAACSSGNTSSSGGGAGSGGSSGGALAKVADVPVGGGKVVDGPNGKTMLVQPAAGEIKAFSAVCPHQGATVDAPQGGVITCPLHGSQFDGATGELRGGPATKGLDPVTVSVQGEDIVAS
jgi:cytochrome b6-f complex iron-sulfur subunit